jgi:hypothetical protein
MGNYSLQGNTYVIENYDKLPPFSSFLSGLAGIKGIPLWVFYTNRGQGINSFGIHNKNNAIMEFNPANTAYENTPLKGFRTFIKCNKEYYEPFQTLSNNVKRNLYIRKNSIRLEEINYDLELKINVKYFVLPKESIGALVRCVEIENIGESEKTVEVVDGMPKIIPYGIHNGAFKEMSNLLKSWTEIKNIENNVPYYTMRASSDDSAEVSEVEGGYFYASVINGQVVPVIYDPEVIFGYDTSLVHPVGFLEHDLESLKNEQQYYVNKVPCGFTADQMNLQPSETQKITTLIGFAGTVAQINEKLADFCNVDYVLKKEQQADEIVDELTKDVKTHTANPVFDQYVEQCYLDNFLRGGYPYVLGKGDKKAVVHLFSRKHGDPERDYNFFSIAGEYYSQGNGNFRDVNQNRRNDVFFQKEIGDFNVKTFFQLMQIDGYNPLEVRPSTFTVKPDHKDAVAKLLQENAGEDSIRLQKVVDKNFTPGQISNCIARYHISLLCEEDVLLETLLGYCSQNISAGFGEGYWSDHWDYNMDLIDNYLSIFPDKEQELLFGDTTYRFYDSPARVLPRSEKYVISKNEARQYGALVHDEEKIHRQGFHKEEANWLKTKQGEFVQTSLMVKLISLGLIKFSTLDPFGMGVEMEGGKPGWNDAMNGLPGLFGSGMAETFELKRLINFIIKTLKNDSTVTMPVEIYNFLSKVAEAIEGSKDENLDDFSYWDTVSTIREEFRQVTRFELEGTECAVSGSEIIPIFQQFAEKIDRGIQKATSYGEGIVPTYFTYHAAEFEEVLGEDGQPAMSHYGLPKAKVKKFTVQPLPAFLEGPAKMLSTMDNRQEAEEISHKVKKSELYDKKLKMYKTSVPIGHISMENGRIRAFTPGWLERESIFLHMEYKYLLSLLKSGLYESFYEEIQTALIPFLPPEQYGRSILENSSFLASSENPDPGVHGRGFVARLSGSTTEMISMWITMFMGNKIFTYENNQLMLHFEPKLSGWMFDKKGEASFTLLSTCQVTYINTKHKDTFGKSGAKVVSIIIEDSGEEIQGNILTGKLAEQVRSGEINNITVHLD